MYIKTCIFKTLIFTAYNCALIVVLLEECANL